MLNCLCLESAEHAEMNTTDSHAFLPEDDVTLQPPAVSQNALDFGVLKQGSSKTLQEVIKNIEKKPLLWTASIGETSWMTLDASAGVLRFGEEQTLNVTVHTNSLVAGNYSAALAITSEADDMSVSRQIIVTLVVNSSDL